MFFLTAALETYTISHYECRIWILYFALVVVALMKQLDTFSLNVIFFSSLWRAIPNWLRVSDIFSIDMQYHALQFG
jgi:hypothetical protein